MIARYQRWIYEKDQKELVEIFNEWLLKEAELRVIAMKKTFGLDWKFEKPKV
jgi:hypothetical protein